MSNEECKGRLWDGITLGILIGVLSMSIMTIILVVIFNTDTRKQAVEKGYAQYNPLTGKWQWKEKAQLRRELLKQGAK